MRQFRVTFNDNSGVIIAARGKQKAQDAAENEELRLGNSSPVMDVRLYTREVQLTLNGFDNGEQATSFNP